MKKVTLRLLISGGLATALLVVLMVWGGVSPIDVLATVRGLPPGVYVLALAAHLFTYTMRALRFRLLVPATHRPPFSRMLLIAAAHNLASYLLPAKTGEASLVLYLRMHCKVPTSTGLACLLVSRFLDGAAMCISLSLVCLVLDRSGRYADLEWLGSMVSLLGGLAVVFLVLSLRGDLLIRSIATLLRWFQLRRWSVGEMLFTRLEGFALSLRSSGSGGRLYLAALVTVFVWIGFFTFDTVLGLAMGLPDFVGFAEITFGASFGSLCNLLPLNGAAGVGTQELGWVTGLHTLLGIDYDDTLSAAMGIHLVQVFNIVVFGLIAHLLMGVIPMAIRRADSAE